MKLRLLISMLFLCASAFGAIARTGNCPATAGTSCTFSATATADLKIMVAFRSGSTTPPTKPAGWTTITTQTGTTSSFIAACNVSSSGADTGSGTWTNATDVVGVSYSGAATTTTANCNFDAVGGNSGATSTNTSQNYVNLNPLRQQAGTSWVVGVGMDKTTTNCTPTGMTGVTNVGAGPAILLSDTNATSSSWGGTTCAVTSSVWLTYTGEVMAKSCQSTPVAGTNFTCVQSKFLDVSQNCANGGSAFDSTPSVTAGNAVIIWFTSVAAPGTMTVTGNLGTGTWSAIPNQGVGATGATWSGGTEGRFIGFPSSSGTLNVTLTCTGASAGGEATFVEIHSSAGTPAVDCSSAYADFSSSSGPYTANCTSTHTNDLFLSTDNWASNPFGAGSGFTYIAEVGNEGVLEYKAQASSGSITGGWVSVAGSQDGVVANVLLSDGSAGATGHCGSCDLSQLEFPQ